MRYEEFTMRDIREEVNENSVAIFPVGAIEEHGPHLPLSTDCLQPEYVAHEVAKRLGNTFVLPVLWYGQCSSTAPFPGTISLRFETLRMMAEDILRELHRNGFGNVVVLSGHAGRLHMAALKLAAETVVKECDMKLMVLSDYDIAYDPEEIQIPEGDGHAGMLETSRVMAIRPDLVRGGAENFHPEFPRFRVLKHPEKYFPGGVMGEPRLAREEFGRKANDIIVERLVELIGAMRKE